MGAVFVNALVMRIVTVLFLLCALSLQVTALGENIPNNVHKLEKPFFDELEAYPGPWVIQFGSPKCKYSNAFDIVFKRSSQDQEQYGCTFGYVDCRKRARLCQYFEVKDYPKVVYVMGNR